MLVYRQIGGPTEAHGATSADEYRRQQAQHIASCRRARPALPWREPWAHDGAPLEAQINWGRWVVACGCGSYSSASPAWGLALCFECGAIYTDITWPADRAAIEAELLTRPQMAQRNWRPGVNLDALKSEVLK